MEDVHLAMPGNLRESFAQHGWPGRSMVGEDGADAAWVIVQHAIGLPAFQRCCLGLLQDAASQGQVPLWQPAYLLDRIRVFEGKPQVYGTQFDFDENGEIGSNPVEDPAGLNARRAAVGLDSIEERISHDACPKHTDSAKINPQIAQSASESITN